MKLTRLVLQHFRNHQDRVFEFTTPVTIVVGPNAAGKTSIIEAIHLLSTGTSLRADTVEEMVGYDQELARVQGVVLESESKRRSKQKSESESAEKTELEVLLTKGIVQGRRTQRRLYSVNGIRRQRRSFVGHLPSVVFRPEDMRLVEGSPGRRRQFLDTALSALFPAYATSLSVYEQTLKRRNKLLGQIKDGFAQPQVLTYWNLQLLKHGEIVQKQRRDFLGSFHSVNVPLIFRVEYLPSVISQERMNHYAETEIAACHTLIGPHKDDLRVLLDERDVALYGSRGQQRLAVLWLKLNELHFTETQLAGKVLLLLDDILSELDEKNQQLVIGLMRERQVLVTTTHAELAEQIQAWVVDDVSTQVVQL